MLKIDVIKFEAQDIITASTSDAPAECSCSPDSYSSHHGWEMIDGSWVYAEWEHTGCAAEEHPNCVPK